MKKSQTLYVVVPCYNEEEVLHETTKRLKEKLESLIKDNVISKESRVMYVNDGSKDKTWELIEEISKEEKLFTGISLSRNRGHQNALLGGLMTAKKYADVIISMDADLQDDINAIDAMLEKYYDGCEIVYGVRSARKTDTWFKKTTAEGFYKFMKLMGVDIVYNHADYRLASKNVLDKLEDFGEVNLFLRGMFPLVGYKSDIVYYERAERFAGESKYPLKKMLNFAWDGITSFSVKPIRFILSFGIVMSMLSFISAVIFIILNLVNTGTLTVGSIISIMCLLTGIQITCIGIVGEYVGKTYSETKRRPRYIISRNLNEEK
ncbi:MAG: glycosyltransferase family 2 protein [Bacilli bacterium]|nr:glycosyltransferase family 2 protein [Bacilli bacterium]